MTVDLSPEAVTARLRLVSELRDVCLALASNHSPVATAKPPKDAAHPLPGYEVAERTESDSASLIPEYPGASKVNHNKE
ncbi:MAG: hypothetical protein ABIJ86_18000 [Spirochaetota bacterium]